MFVEGLLHMYRRGVLRRQVEDGSVLHGAFYLGSPRFYEALRALDDEDRARFSMRSVRYTNLLYSDEEQKRAERAHARFINSAMMVTGLGAMVSDGLDDGRVVSGVGGQYEFVTMAHALPDARSIMMVPATRTSRGEVHSNVVWSYGHCTIPRHLRDIVVTEYGIADLRGKSDEEIVKALIGVCDARFQDELLERARTARKIDPRWQIPERARKNRPEWIRDAFSTYRTDGTIPRCPFGSSLSEVELDLVLALRHLKSLSEDLQARRIPEISRENLARALRGTDNWDAHLARMGLLEPSSLREHALQRAVLFGLKESAGR
jgi:acyl-CoA hydrolase